jgi:hypothetical protein
MNRRHFLASSAALAAASIFPAPALIAGSPNEEVRVCVLGNGNKGREHSSILNRLAAAGEPYKLAGICEVDSVRLDQGKKAFNPAKTFTDPRKVFDDPEIDAVVIATPNHWHCLGGIWAMQAGKHVYVEKPLCLSFWEGQQLFNASRKYKKCVQIGTQMRTDREAHAEVKKFLHEEKALGKLLAVRVNRYFVRRPIGLRETPLTVQPEVNYNLWLGPADDLPLYRNQLHYDWHFMWNTGNGETGNWGAHLLDDCRNDIFCNQISIPKRVFSCGGRLGIKDAGETPNTMFTYFDTGSAPVIFGFSGMEDKAKRGATCPCVGPNPGYIAYFEGGTYQKPWGPAAAYDTEGKKIRDFKTSDYGAGAYNHLKNFCDSVRANDPSNLNGEIQVGWDTSFWYNSANVAYRLGGSWSKEKALAMTADTGKLGEMIDDMKKYLATQEIAMDETFALSPMLTLDETTRRFVGENADEANSLMDRRPGRGDFVVPEVKLD